MIIGAGASGLMCATKAGKRGRHVLVLGHAKKLGEKIRISGGGAVIIPIFMQRLKNAHMENPPLKKNRDIKQGARKVKK